MLDEGTAREIINRVQKLRKKAHLVPTDLITVYYNVSPTGELSRVAKEWNDFIVNVLKVPFVDGQAVGNIIIEETQTVIMNYFINYPVLYNNKFNLHFYCNVSMYYKKTNNNLSYQLTINIHYVHYCKDYYTYVYFMFSLKDLI